MELPIQSVAELGLALRATRRAGRVRLDDLAQITGVSKQFLSDVEYGKPTVQLGLVLKLLQEVGISMTLEVPQDALLELDKLRMKGGLHKASRSAKSEAVTGITPTLTKETD